MRVETVFSNGPGTFDAATHRLVRWPVCRSCRSRKVRRSQRDVSPRDVTSSILGPFRAFHPSGRQSPLARAVAVISKPHGSGLERFEGFGLTLAHAEKAAAELAAAALTAAMARQLIKANKKKFRSLAECSSSKAFRLLQKVKLRNIYFAAGSTREEAKTKAILLLLERQPIRRVDWLPLKFPSENEETRYIRMTIEGESKDFIVERTEQFGLHLVRARINGLVTMAIHTTLAHATELAMARALIAVVSGNGAKDYCLNIDPGLWKGYWQKYGPRARRQSFGLVMEVSNFFPELAEVGLFVAFAIGGRGEDCGCWQRVGVPAPVKRA